MSETPLEIVDELTVGSDVGWRYHYQDRMLAALERFAVNERAAARQEAFVAMMHSMKEAVDEEWGSYGGTDGGEPDCPGKPGQGPLGSRHARPEGLSAGARYLRGGTW